MQVHGSCHCESIRFRAVVDETKVSICHCTDCQKLTGTAYRVSVPASADSFQLERGAPKVYLKRGDSGAMRAQAFCGDCGSPLYTYAAGATPPGSYGVRVGTLQERAHLAPTMRKWCASELLWSLDISRLPGRPGDT